MVNTTGSPTGLGRELATARLATGKSLRDIASAAGISAAYLQKLERGQVEEPSPKILNRLAETLNLSYATLMRLAGYESGDESPPIRPLNARLATADLTTAEERAVAAFIEHLVAQRRTKP